MPRLYCFAEYLVNAWLLSEAHSESSQASKMEPLKWFSVVTYFHKVSILDVWLGSEWASRFA